MSERYETARAIAEAAASRWDRFSDTSGVAWLADEIANILRQRDEWRALYEQTDPNQPTELCDCGIGDCVRFCRKCRQCSSPGNAGYLGAQSEPVAWAFEWMSRGGWVEGISRSHPGSLGTRKVEPLFKQAPAAPRTGSGVSVEEIAKLCDRLDRLNTISEPQACADVMDEARLMILALIAQAPRDGGATQGGWEEGTHR